MVQNLDKKASAISGMFNNIAASYDGLNHTLSFGIDILWRKKLVSLLKKTEAEKVLDLACGTGDLTIALARSGYQVVGMDIAEKMVEVAKRKAAKSLSESNMASQMENSIDFVIGSAEAIPFGDSAFDAVSISFGIRNFDNRQQCLSEINRVTNKGGSLYILEFALPSNKILKVLYLLYLTHILPMIGAMVSKDKSAYRYLSDSIQAFPRYEQFCNEIRQSGYSEVCFHKLSGGIALLYVAKK